MYKLTAIFLVAFLASESVATSHRLKRQSGEASTSAAPPTPAPPAVAAQAQNQTVSPKVIIPGDVAQSTSRPSQVDRQACLQSCPVTSEFNPVCGSNGVTYSNPGRLICDQFCGVDVDQVRVGRCLNN